MRSVHKWVCIFNYVTCSALQPKTIFVFHVLHCGVVYTESPGTAPVSPRCKLTFSRGWGWCKGRPKGEEQTCSAGHLGRWHCWAWWMLPALLLSNPIPFKKIQQSRWFAEASTTGSAWHWAWTDNTGFVPVIYNHSSWFPVYMNISEGTEHPTLDWGWKKPRVFKLP